MASPSDTHAPPTDSVIHSFAPPKLPAELLYIMVSHVVINYLDDVIAGPLAMPSSSLETIEHDMARFKAAPAPNGELAAAGDNLDAEGVVTFDLHSDKTLEENNPIITLLQSGVQLRVMTLHVLSNLLGTKLSKEGLGRLEEKPWRSIQLTRYCWANPAYIYHFRRHFDFHITTASSALVMLYTKISLNRFKLQLARQSIDGMTDDNFIDTYGLAERHTDELIPSSWKLIALPRLIQDEIARAKIQERIDTLAMEMSEVIVFKIHTAIWRYFYATVSDVERTYQLHPSQNQIGNIDQRLSGLYQLFFEALSGSYSIVNRIKILSYVPNDAAHIKEVDSAREVLQNIIQYEAREGLGYSQCRNAAQKWCDWLDGISFC